MRYTPEQRKAAEAGVGISGLARKFGLAYGDAGRLIERVRIKKRQAELNSLNGGTPCSQPSESSSSSQ